MIVLYFCINLRMLLLVLPRRFSSVELHFILPLQQRLIIIVTIFHFRGVVQTKFLVYEIQIKVRNQIDEITKRQQTSTTQ